MNYDSKKEFFDSIIPYLDLSEADPAQLRKINSKLRDLIPQLQARESASPYPPIPQPHFLKKPPFDFRNCRAYQKIVNEMCHHSITQKKLLEIAHSIIDSYPHLSKTLTRDMKRNKPLLFKWFNDHLDEIEPKLNEMKFLAEEFKPLSNP